MLVKYTEFKHIKGENRIETFGKHISMWLILIIVTEAELAKGHKAESSNKLVIFGLADLLLKYDRDGYWALKYPIYINDR